MSLLRLSSDLRQNHLQSFIRFLGTLIQFAQFSEAQPAANIPRLNQNVT